MHGRTPRPHGRWRAAAVVLSAVLTGTLMTPAAVVAAPSSGSIQGRLVSHSGRPVAGEVVAVDEATGAEYRDVAGADGSYEIAGVPAGRYAVLFRPSRDASSDAPFGYVDAWFPNTPHGDSGARVIVEPGIDTVAVDSALRPAGRVTGALTGATGAYAAALIDESAPVDPFDGDTPVIEVEVDGVFELRAPEGDYELLVYRRVAGMWQPYEGAAGGRAVRVDSGADTRIGDLAMPEPGALDVVLRLPDGAAAPDVDVTLARRDASCLERDGLTDAAGRSLFEGLAPGVYGVSVGGPAAEPTRFSREVTVDPGRARDLVVTLDA